MMLVCRPTSPPCRRPGRVAGAGRRAGRDDRPAGGGAGRAALAHRTAAGAAGPAASHAVRPLVGEAGRRHRAAGTGAGGPRGGERRRGGAAAACGLASRDRCGIQAGTAAAAGASAPRRGRACRRLCLPGLWRGAAPPRRGRDRGAGLRARLVSGHPARTAEVLLPLLQDDHPGACAQPAGAPRPRRARAARPRAGGEVLRPPATLPPVRDVCPRGCRPGALHPGRLGGTGCRAAAAPGRRAGAIRHGGRSPARRRHARAGARPGHRQDQHRARPAPGATSTGRDQHRAPLGLPARRDRACWHRPACGALPLQPRSPR